MGRETLRLITGETETKMGSADSEMIRAVRRPRSRRGGRRQK